MRKLLVVQRNESQIFGVIRSLEKKYLSGDMTDKLRFALRFLKSDQVWHGASSFEQVELYRDQVRFHSYLKTRQNFFIIADEIINRIGSISIIVDGYTRLDKGSQDFLSAIHNHRGAVAVEYNNSPD